MKIQNVKKTLSPETIKRFQRVANEVSDFYKNNKPETLYNRNKKFVSEMDNFQKQIEESSTKLINSKTIYK